ncbi:hypothetical protein X474_11795 [Dethiosulfatarculus sandiegensis]|uniref:Uncharacterized protein n=1 Tax=Dethiosulfatarculus sandiegensis TaxID=1429043 RepID=A0A0D2J6T7_9BACT|nr:hypothetical protein X474_11795 [Dethiosulfatarculus sandiegensis]
MIIITLLNIDAVLFFLQKKRPKPQGRQCEQPPVWPALGLDRATILKAMHRVRQSTVHL